MSKNGSIWTDMKILTSFFSVKKIVTGTNNPHFEFNCILGNFWEFSRFSSGTSKYRAKKHPTHQNFYWEHLKPFRGHPGGPETAFRILQFGWGTCDPSGSWTIMVGKHVNIKIIYLLENFLLHWNFSIVYYHVIDNLLMRTKF